ncbi:MAG: MBL fold metallo-hydrolase [Verrucomicrobiales bacterium]
MSFRALTWAGPVAAGVAAFWLAAGEPEVAELVREADGEVWLTASAEAGAFYRIETSSDLREWAALVTVRSTGSDQLFDVAALRHDQRYYRAVLVAGEGVVTGDHLETEQGDAVLHPIGHASVGVVWNEKTLYSDPSDLNGNGPRFADLPKGDVILVTHTHGDHFAVSRLNQLVTPETVLFAPQSVFNGLPTTNVPGQNFTLRSRTTVLANGATGTAHGFEVQAIAMYNLSNSNHPQGVGNGYVVRLGGKRLYFSGDTEDIPEMRALESIDVAFVCMSLPSNMTVDAAASAVRAFRPGIVFPYHFRQSVLFDTQRFKNLVGTDLGIEVRQRAWY